MYHLNMDAIYRASQRFSYPLYRGRLRLSVPALVQFLERRRTSYTATSRSGSQYCVPYLRSSRCGGAECCAVELTFMNLVNAFDASDCDDRMSEALKAISGKEVPLSLEQRDG